MTPDSLGWLTDRQRDGGVDEIPLPAGGRGRGAGRAGAGPEVGAQLDVVHALAADVRLA